jgi:transposase-like protein
MTKAEQTRLVTWRFRVLQRAAAGSRNVARTCRHFGISRKTFYKWKHRYDAHGAARLGDRARAPQRSPRHSRAASPDWSRSSRITAHLSTAVILTQIFLAAGLSASVFDFERSAAAGVFIASSANAASR